MLILNMMPTIPAPDHLELYQLISIQIKKGIIVMMTSKTVLIDRQLVSLLSIKSKDTSQVLPNNELTIP